MRDAAVRAFEAAGWLVTVDRPLSGALVPMRFNRTDPRVTAIMVEIDRGLYMDEASGERRTCPGDVGQRIRNVLRTVAAKV